ncbi:hypothetical protein [Arenibaculum sp.]|uniref:hypothetical protein n=1 Tax=Arenibaculum sp. TaxID=2865862 RepID=UPI002E152C66|nr:hypothetical protein [Arenibaculum sp.]
MRAPILALWMVLTPALAFAQDASNAPAEMPAAPAVPLAQSVPMPSEMVEGPTGYQVAAIAAGAVAGVVVANVATGGMITPVLVAGASGGGQLMNASYAVMAGQAAVTTVGAVVGGYVGNWLYGN